MTNISVFQAAAPLDPALGIKGASFSIQAGALLGMIRVQGRAVAQELTTVVQQHTGLALPEPGTVSRSDMHRLHWLTPQEWLLVTAEGAEHAIAADLAAAWQGQALYATVISDSRAVIEVSGPDAPTLLAQGCALDFHATQFAVLHSTVTRFAGVAAMVTRIEGDCFELVVDRALARYVWDWLAESVKGL